MACCKCCCEAGTPPGECCGSPEVCCKEPDICCGPSGSKTCCEDPRVCCGVGSGQECCPEGDLCCGEECCPPSQECCGTGESQVCCNEGQYCCDGVCEDEPCGVCQPCETCWWPGGRSERVDYPDETLAGWQSLGNGPPRSFRSQDIVSAPSGVVWKDGYPDALDGCNIAWVANGTARSCVCDNSLWVGNAYVRTRYKLYVLNCETGEAEDVTSMATDGEIESCSNCPPSGDCQCTEELEVYGAPIPICEDP